MKTIEFIDELNSYLMAGYNYKTPPAKKGLSNTTIDARRSKFDLYFRCNLKPEGFWEQNTFVIARICFKPKEKGSGRNLLQFLVDRAACYNYTKIGIEETNTNDGVMFAEKLGFEPYLSENNWIICVDKLKANLSSYTSL